VKLLWRDRNLKSTGWASWPVLASSGTLTFSVTLTWRSFVTALNSGTWIGMDGPLGNRCAFPASHAITIIARTSIVAQIGANAQRAKNKGTYMSVLLIANEGAE
jgi:NAD(P)H-flavin reductase